MTGLSFATDFVTGQWYHVIENQMIAGPNRQFELFLNGVSLGTTVVGTVSASDVGLMLGDDFRSFAGVLDIRVNPVRGMIDQTAIWDRSLAPAEIQTLYGGGNGFAIPEPGSITFILLGSAAVFGRRRSQAAS